MDLVSETAMKHLLERLSDIKQNHFANADCVTRDVRRVPIKPIGASEDEVNHLALSSDGLWFFHPLTLHQHNWAVLASQNIHHLKC
jgi:hypothetical protein